MTNDTGFRTVHLRPDTFKALRELKAEEDRHIYLIVEDSVREYLNRHYVAAVRPTEGVN